MALDLTVQYPGKIGPATPAFPYGEPRNITAPNDGTGTPWEAAIVKDLEGFKQALLTLSGIVPSGTPDEVGASQYLQSIIEIASGRAINYDESGTANDYILDPKTDQQAPASYFDGLIVEFQPSTGKNTGAVTIDLDGLGVVPALNVNGDAFNAGQLNANIRYKFRHNGTNFIKMVGDTITGQITFPGVAANGGVGVDVSVAHGLGVEDIDFGCSVRNENGTFANRNTNSIARITGNDGRTYINDTTPSGSASSLTLFVQPNIGDININVINESSSVENVVVDYWVRAR